MQDTQHTLFVNDAPGVATPVGETIGPYRLLGKIGAGGMGVVYRAHDPRLGRDVAIKLIRPDHISPQLTAAFLREARLASSLNHPGIVTIYDIVTHGEAQCIVMEYIEGAPLKSAVAVGDLAVDEAKRLALEIGHALSAAHRTGIVHRDLKPGNIMVTRDGRIKIVDFGLSVALRNTLGVWEETGTASLTREFAGTIGYMAPENVRGEAVSLRGDIFSFAVVFHEILTGRLPFSAADPASLLWAMQRDEPIPPSLQRPGLSRSFDPVVARGLKKNPNERYQTIDEFVEEILRAESDSFHKLLRSTSGNLLGSPSSTRLRFTEPPATGTEQTSIAVLPFTTLSPDPEDNYLAVGLASELVSALTGLPGLRIAPQLSAYRTQERGADPLSASRELNARYILSGSLQRRGERIRVHAELTDGEHGTVCWSRNYDRLAVDLFDLQEEIARTIVKSLGGQFIRVATDFAFRSPTANLDAWGLLRKAYHLWNYQFSLESVHTAIELCRRAVSLDPEYANAQANLGLYLIQSVVHSISINPESDEREAIAAAEVATRTAPQDADVLASSAIVFIHVGQYEKAVLNVRQAVRIAPYDLVSWGYLGFAHACAGGPPQLEEAVKILTQLIAHSSDHPSLPYWEQFLTIAALRLGRFDLAVEHGRRAVELQPGFVHNLVLLAEALCRSGHEPEARETVSSIPLYNPGFTLDDFEQVALKSCRSRERAEQLCGRVRSLNLLH